VEDLARWAVESWAVAIGAAGATEPLTPVKPPKYGDKNSANTELADEKKSGAPSYIVKNGRKTPVASDSQSRLQTISAENEVSIPGNTADTDAGVELDDTERKAVDLVLESEDLRNSLEEEVNAVVTQAVRKICKAHGVLLTVDQAQNVAMVLFGD